MCSSIPISVSSRVGSILHLIHADVLHNSDHPDECHRPTGRDDGLEGSLKMNPDEYGTKFNNLVSIDYIYLPSNRLTRIPSLKNMGKLKTLSLAQNRITRISPGDFVGATQLVSLQLSGNSIVSIAEEAFFVLSAFRTLPQAFNPTNRDGTPYVVTTLSTRGHWLDVGGGDIHGGRSTPSVSSANLC